MFFAVLLLVVAVLALFWPVRDYRFINFDDPEYAADNPQVREGLSLRSMVWALTATSTANWHPLTWLSHLADGQLFGQKPGGHHLVNVLFHAAGTLLLFLVWRGLTGACWPSLLVAALFGLHPLHVESVAWVSERKDVLSGFFWMLTMAAYLHQVRRPSPGRMLLTAACLALGLMAKPMLVTLPLVLLLLDWWPLGRFPRRAGEWPRVTGRLLLDKAPLFLLAAASGIITFLVQRQGGAVASIHKLTLSSRLAHAAVAYLWYAVKMVWPAHLGIIYLHPVVPPPAWQTLAGAGFLLAGTIAALRWGSRRPFLLTGWLWYAVTLLPVIGLVQVGNQAVADRYSYLTLIGLFVMIAWGGGELAASSRTARLATAGAAVAVVLTLGLAARHQLGYWKDSETLFGRAVALSGDNWLARNSLGMAFGEQERLPEAEAELREAVRLEPRFALAHYNLGVTYLKMGKPREAQGALARAIEIRPDYTEAHYNLGVAFLNLGRIEEAMEEYREAIRLQPDLGPAHFALGYVQATRGERAAALGEYEILRRLDPESAGRLRGFIHP